MLKGLFRNRPSMNIAASTEVNEGQGWAGSWKVQKCYERNSIQ